MKHDFSKGTSLALVAGMYVLALGFGVRAFAWAVDVMPEVWALLVADVVMTVLIWGFGLAYENVSIYDPYWSVIRRRCSPRGPSTSTVSRFRSSCFSSPCGGGESGSPEIGRGLSRESGTRTGAIPGTGRRCRRSFSR